MGIVVRAALAGAVLLATAAPAVAQPAATPAPARPASSGATVPACSSGLVALTFDDGPARSLTPQLVSVLHQYDVPATFFMVGARVHTAPRAARVVAKAGFAIGNHTWSHARLTRLSDRQVRSQLRRTARELRADGIRPTGLMRPPYGEIDARVRRDVRALRLVPVLWDVDSQDWRGGSARHIARSILRQLRPHRSNIVLQHDGVPNSPATVSAVPLVIRAAHRRGYCFAALGADGRMAPPVPTVRGSVVGGSETGPTAARVRISLSEPTSRPVSLRVTARSGTAVAGEDFAPVQLRVSFPVGATHAVVDVPVIDDTVVEPVEEFHVTFDAPYGVAIDGADHVGTITSDDSGP